MAKKPIDKNKPLTIKQRKFVNEYVANDGNGREAAKAVFRVTTDGSAATLATQTLNRPNVKAAIENALKTHGITIEKATKPIADGLQATREVATKGGMVERADHPTRLKASGMALKLLGADQKEEKATVNFNFGGDASATFDMGKYKQ